MRIRICFVNTRAYAPDFASVAYGWSKTVRASRTWKPTSQNQSQNQGFRSRDGIRLRWANGRRGMAVYLKDKAVGCEPLGVTCGAIGMFYLPGQVREEKRSKEGHSGAKRTVAQSFYA